MLSSAVSDTDEPQELFKNMNSLAQATLSKLESPEMGPSTPILYRPPQRTLMLATPKREPM